MLAINIEKTLTSLSGNNRYYCIDVHEYHQACMHGHHLVFAVWMFPKVFVYNLLQIASADFVVVDKKRNLEQKIL